MTRGEGYKRVFVGLYEYMSVWYSVTSMDKKDLFLIYKISGEEISGSEQKLKSLKNKATVVFKDVSEMGDSDRQRLILDDLRECGEAAYVYFLSDTDDYESCKDYGYWKEISTCRNLREANLRYSEKKKKEEDSERIRKPKETQKKEKQAPLQSDPDIMGDLISGLDSDDDDYSAYGTNVKNGTEQNSHPKGNKEHNTGDNGKRDGGDRADRADRNDGRDRGYRNNERSGEYRNSRKDNGQEKRDIHKSWSDGANNRGVKKPAASQGVPKPPAVAEKTLEEIEKEIFGGEFESTEIVREYTELDDSKARTAAYTFQRLVDSINLFVDGDCDTEAIKEEDYLSFIVMLLKADSLKDFIESWEVLHIFDVSLSGDEFTWLKSQAAYYNDLCRLFYTRDKW